MIAGIGTDIAAVKRLAALYEKHGKKSLERLLAPSEYEEFEKANHKGRFLAKRFAAKEALGKALGTGIVAPALLPNMAVVHDFLGKPSFIFAPELEALIKAKRIAVHLSISDEDEYAVAFVLLESKK